MKIIKIRLQNNTEDEFFFADDMIIYIKNKI